MNIICSLNEVLVRMPLGLLLFGATLAHCFQEAKILKLTRKFQPKVLLPTLTKKSSRIVFGQMLSKQMFAHTCLHVNIDFNKNNFHLQIPLRHVCQGVKLWIRKDISL